MKIYQLKNVDNFCKELAKAMVEADFVSASAIEWETGTVIAYINAVYMGNAPITNYGALYLAIGNTITNYIVKSKQERR